MDRDEKHSGAGGVWLRALALALALAQALVSEALGRLRCSAIRLIVHGGKGMQIAGTERMRLTQGR